MAKPVGLGSAAGGPAPGAGPGGQAQAMQAPSWWPRAAGFSGMAEPVDSGSAAAGLAPGAGPGGQAWGRPGAELAAQGRAWPGR